MRTLKISLLVVLLAFISVSGIFAQTIKGVVLDENSKPLPFVSIYLKSNPYGSISSGSDGTFNMETDISKLNKTDLLIFSFIGYKTIEKEVSSISNDERLTIKMVEQPILLQGAAVTAKVSKKTEKAAKTAFLKKFKERLKVDFPDNQKQYKVVSQMKVTQGAEVVGSNEVIAQMQELKSKKGRDSIWISKVSVKEYLNEQLKGEIARIAAKNKADTVVVGKKKKKQPRSDFKSVYEFVEADASKIDKRSMELHKGLWEWNSNIKKIVNSLDANPKNWELSYTNDNVLLTYSKKQGFLGIIRVESKVFFYIDDETFELLSMAEAMTAEVNIPFGLKLKENELELLNAINLTGVEFEKYRLRHLNADIKRNVIFRTSPYGKYAGEKNMNSVFSLEDSKNRKLEYKATALSRVLESVIINKR